MRRILAACIGGAMLMSTGLVQAADSTPPISGYDTSKPIEITADQLEVLQEQEQAIFSGNVEAVQGQVHLKSDEMTVHYSAEATENKISRIDVRGSVFLSTPRETAQGQRGQYNVEKGVVELHDHVLLTRDQNVIRGDTLVYNLKTGRSRVSSAGSKSAVPGQKTEGGRVKGLFVPGGSK